MDHLIESEMRRWMIPGLSLAVVRHGRLVCARGFGLADRERSRPATEHTVYPLASVTKTFVATAVMLLVEDGALEVDRPVAEVLPGLPRSWAGVTVRHLLSHTSGIRDCYADAGFWYDTPATVSDRIGAVARLGLVFPPGRRWYYSNTGYLLLGEVIARVSGLAYDRLLADRVFTPLGMTRTRVNDPRQADEGWATGYRRRFRWTRLRSDVAAVAVPHHLIAGSADGGLVSTATDLAAWAIALASGRVVREETLRRMWAPAILMGDKKAPCGLGWGVDDSKGRRVIGHSGGDPGFATSFQHFVEERITVAILANRGGNWFLGIHEAMFDLAAKIARAWRSQRAGSAAR
jgi:CubicO group peptidase (beta-lactamase class C family)